jgi:hypothetical protein
MGTVKGYYRPMSRSEWEVGEGSGWRSIFRGGGCE